MHRTDRCSPPSCHRLAPCMLVFIVFSTLHYKVTYNAASQAETAQRCRRLWRAHLANIVKIRTDLGGIQRLVAGGRIPGNTTTHNSLVLCIELAPINAAGFLQGRMPIYENKVYPLVVLPHLRLPPEILVVNRRCAFGETAARRIVALSSGSIGLLVANAASDFLWVVGAVDLGHGNRLHGFKDK